MDDMLNCKNLSYESARKSIIMQISLQLSLGEVLALMGPNGSGKTTLLKIISGLLNPTSGLIEIDGVGFHTLSRKEKSRLISLVPQTTPITFEFTAHDIIMMGAYAVGGLKTTFDDIVDRLSIKHLAKRPFHCLSAGERQRCYLARTLIADTPYMLLDEPSSHQDIKGKELLHREIERLKQSGKGILLATHDQDLANKCADRVIYIDAGITSFETITCPCPPS